AIDLEARLREFGDALRAGSARAQSVLPRLLASDFRGGRLLADADATPAGASAAAFEVKRTADAAPAAGAAPAAAAKADAARTLDARAFGAEIQRLVGDMRE